VAGWLGLVAAAAAQDPNPIKPAEYAPVAGGIPVTPTVARVGHLEMPVMSFELFRRIATDAIQTPDLLADRPAPFIAADR